jgi:hypothetical protein
MTDQNYDIMTLTASRGVLLHCVQAGSAALYPGVPSAIQPSARLVLGVCCMDAGDA